MHKTFAKMLHQNLLVSAILPAVVDKRTYSISTFVPEPHDVSAKLPITLSEAGCPSKRGYPPGPHDEGR